jgi:hypothetical protein
MDIPKADFYDCDPDRGYLVSTTPEDALQAWADTNPGEPATLYCWVRKRIDDTWFRHVADDLIERALVDHYAEDFGNPDDDARDELADGAEDAARPLMLEALKALFGGGTVWQCDRVVSVELTAEEVAAFLEGKAA